MHTRTIGQSGEAAALAFVQSLGWKVIGQNLHYRFGEIDILADTGDHVVLIEVKVKKTDSHGMAVEMITATKRRVLLKLAKCIVSQYNRPVRIDVITIDNFASHAPTITHYPFALGE